jgi:hypothetical protein
MRFETESALALEVAFDGGRITSDGGLLWLSEVDSEMGLCEAVSECVAEWRTRKGRHSLASLVKQRVFQIACGYDDQNDSDTLREDPLLKLSCGSLPESGQDLASQPTICRMENAATRSSCRRMAEVLLEVYLREREKDGAPQRVLLDFDATDDPAHGDQEGSYYHGYYREHIYHPLLVFDGESGHLICALLRAGNTHASNSSVAILKRIVSRLRERWPEVHIELRADAGFAVPDIYDYCEREGITYTIALITNDRLLEMAEELLEEAKESYQGTGRKTRLFSEGTYQAASWEKRRRVVYKAEVMEQGTNRRFLLTTRSDEPKDLYEFYARRGERELDKGLQAPHKSGSPQLPQVHSQPVQAAVARGGLLAYGHFEKEAHRKRSSSDAARQPTPSSDQDRWQGQGTNDEGTPASGVGASGTRFVARSFGSIRRRS